MWDQLLVLTCLFISLKLQILKSFRHHAKACAPQNVQITCHPDRMELTFPATAVGGSQEQVEHEKMISVSVQDQFQDYFLLFKGLRVDFEATFVMKIRFAM